MFELVHLYFESCMRSYTTKCTLTLIEFCCYATCVLAICDKTSNSDEVHRNKLVCLVLALSPLHVIIKVALENAALRMLIQTKIKCSE